MNFLLVMPRIVNKVGDGYSFPLGLPYVSAAMKKAGLNVFTYNLNHHDGSVEELVKEQIEEHNIDVFLTGGAFLSILSDQAVDGGGKKELSRNADCLRGRNYNGRSRGGDGSFAGG